MPVELPVERLGLEDHLHIEVDRGGAGDIHLALQIGVFDQEHRLVRTPERQVVAARRVLEACIADRVVESRDGNVLGILEA